MAEIPPISGSQPSSGAGGSPYGLAFDRKLLELEDNFRQYPKKDGWDALQKFLEENLSKFPKSSPEAAVATQIINQPYGDLRELLPWAQQHFSTLNKALGIIP